MAYGERGSRSIQVDRLTYRWRAHDRGELAVWHVLDDGLLRVSTPHDVRWQFDPTPAYVARCIRIARRLGWNLTDHFELPLDPALFAEATAHAAQGRTVDQQLEQLGFGPLPSAEVVLRLLVRQGPVGFLLTPAGLTVYAVLDGTLHHLEASGDPDWLRDIAVDIQEAPESPPLPVNAVLDLRTSTRELSLRTSLDDPRVQAAAQGLWRLAMSQLPLPERCPIELLHPQLSLPEPPWIRTGRRLRVFGTLDRLPPLHSGGILVDARNLEHITEGARAELRALPELGDLWVGPCEDVERRRSKTLASAERAQPEAVRMALLRRIIVHLDPRWRDRAAEVLGKAQSLRGMERWVPLWQETAAPTKATWISPDVSHGAPAPPWFAMNATGLWAGLEDGRVVTPPPLEVP